MAAALIHEDRRAGGGAGMKKLIGAFRDCANAHKKDSFDTEPSHILFLGKKTRSMRSNEPPDVAFEPPDLNRTPLISTATFHEH